MTVAVEHNDYEGGYYDSEDDRWLFIDQKCHPELDFELETTIEVSTDTDYEEAYVETINDSKAFDNNEIIRAYEERY